MTQHLEHHRMTPQQELSHQKTGCTKKSEADLQMERRGNFDSKVEINNNIELCDGWILEQSQFCSITQE